MSESTTGDLTRLTAADLAARLAAGEVSSVEATRAHLDRIAAGQEDRIDWLTRFYFGQGSQALAVVEAERPCGRGGVGHL